MPSHAREDLKTALTAGGVVGGFIGMVVYIWAAIQFIKPALRDHGLNDIKASFITLGLSLGIGVEVAVLLGVLYGLMKALILFALIYGAIYCFSNPKQRGLTATSLESGQLVPAINPSLVALSTKSAKAIEANDKTRNEKTPDPLKEKGGRQIVVASAEQEAGASNNPAVFQLRS